MSAVPRKRRKVRTYLATRTAGRGSHLGQIKDRPAKNSSKSAGAFCCLSAKCTVSVSLVGASWRDPNRGTRERFTAFPVTATPVGVRGYELRGIIRPGSEREFNGVHVLAIALVCRVSPRMQERLKADAGRNPPLCGSRQGYWAAWREALALGKHGARRQSRALAVCRGRA